MAIKDWKKIRDSTNIKVWKNKKTGKEIFIDSDTYRNQDDSVLFGVNNNPTRRFGEGMSSSNRSKSQALKFAKEYMRKH